MRFILLLALLVGCGKTTVTQPASDPSIPGVTPPVSSTKYCYQYPGCIASCVELDPYQGRQAIINDCSARGLLNSGICDKMLSDDAAAEQRFEDCKASPI